MEQQIRFIMETTNTSDVETTIDSQRKITLGFKCLPSVKAMLMEEAEEEGLTLSSYVESLINQMPENNNQMTQMLDENGKLKSRIALMTKRLSIYENECLQNLYMSHLNQTVTYTNLKGEKVEKEIVFLPDVYEVIINSFKYTD